MHPVSFKYTKRTFNKNAPKPPSKARHAACLLLPSGAAADRTGRRADGRRDVAHRGSFGRGETALATLAALGRTALTCKKNKKTEELLSRGRKQLNGMQAPQNLQLATWAISATGAFAPYQAGPGVARLALSPPMRTCMPYLGKRVFVRLHGLPLVRGTCMEGPLYQICPPSMHSWAGIAGNHRGDQHSQPPSICWCSNSGCVRNQGSLLQ